MVPLTVLKRNLFSTIKKLLESWKGSMDVKDLHATIDAKTVFECVNQLEPLTAPLQFFIKL